MATVLLIVELFVTLALIGIVLIQRSEGGGLGIGGSQGMGSFMSGRGTANLLTRTTAVLATIFMALALALGLINRSTGEGSILNSPPPPAATSTAPASAPSGPAHSAPAAPPKLPATPALPALPAVPTK